MKHLATAGAFTGAGRARSDLAWVLAAAAATFVLAGRIGLQERLSALTLPFERWQVDELPLTLLVLSLGLAWYAWRRRGEAARLLAHNRELAQRLIQVQDAERLALARELHDELGQHCTALRIEATVIERARDPAQAAAAAQRAASSAELLHEGVRRLLRRLRPAELDELGLAAALRSLCDSWESRSRLRCTLVLQGELKGLGEALDTALFRVTQEALSNVVRHAHADEVRIELRATPAALVLTVQDDGRGLPAARRHEGLGLLGAAERAAALGGRFEATTAPGGGTCLRMTLPRLPAPRAWPEVST